MESLEVEYVGPEDINENSEYDALNDETFGNAEDTGDDDWEQEHEKFAIIEENFRKFTTTPLDEVLNGENLEKPKLKSLEEIERELMKRNSEHVASPSASQQLNQNLLYTSVQDQALQQTPLALSNNRVDLPAQQMNHITLVSQTPGIVRVDSTQLLLPWQKQGQYENVQLPAQQYVSRLPQAPPTTEDGQAIHSSDHPQAQPYHPVGQSQSVYSINQTQGQSNGPSQPIHRIGQTQSIQSIAQPHNSVGQSQPNHTQHMSESEMEQEEYDPYAGLMNQRERRWLANIQVMQLEGDDPDYDFYFTEYQKRHGLQHRSSNNDKYNGLHNIDSLKSSYVPLQFENSLGKVQVGSVQAPRKVIDREIFSNGTKSPLGADAKRKPRKKLKHILLELEYMYTALQRLDNQNAGTNQQRRPPQPPPLEVGSTSTVNDYPTDPQVLMSSFLKDRDHFLAYMSIRKGKVLGYRLLRLQQNDRFWLMMFQDFVVLVTRDQTEEILLTYLPVLRSWLQARGSWEMLCCILPALMEDGADFALTNKFGMSVIASIIETAESLYNANCHCLKEQHELYVQFMMTLVDKGAIHKSELQRPVMGIDMKTLESNFYRIESHFFRIHQRVDASKKAILVHALALPTYQKKKNKIKHTIMTGKI